MGWTSTYTGKLTSSEKKELLDREYNFTDGDIKSTVIKSCLKGKVYYAAVERIHVKTNERVVFAGVALTDLYKGEFYYKFMHESMNPCEYSCPDSILDLLTPTNDNDSIEWRDRCRKLNNSKKSLSQIPIGSTISFTLYDKTYKLTKMPPAYQFKRPWFLNKENNRYWKKTQIPSNWIIA